MYEFIPVKLHFNFIIFRICGQTLLYYADFDNLPYGAKNRVELEKIAEENYKKFLPFSPKTVVFACNTMSVNTLSKEFYFGVETIRVLPKVKTNEKGLLLCTGATAKSQYVKNLKLQNPLLDVLPLDGLAQDVEKFLFYKRQTVFG